MNRRDFVQYLALTAVTGAALPNQVAAFHDYYEVNVPHSPGPYLAMDEVSVSGIANVGSTALRIVFCQSGRIVRNASLNAFGGIYFWHAAHDGKIPASAADPITWKMSLPPWQSDTQPLLAPRPYPDDYLTDAWVKNHVTGQISFIDSELRRQYIPIDTVSGRVA